MHLDVKVSKLISSLSDYEKYHKLTIYNYDSDSDIETKEASFAGKYIIDDNIQVGVEGDTVVCQIFDRVS